MKGWNTLSSKLIHENPFMRLVAYDVVRPNGYRGPYYVLERTDYAMIIPLTEKNETYLVGQYRYPIKKYSWEFPSGSVIGKSQRETARIELEEETGIHASKWTLIGRFCGAPGHNRQKTKVFVAQDLIQKKAQPEQNELLEIKKLPIVQVGEMIVQGKIIDGPTICAYHLLEVYWKKNYNKNL